MTAIYLRTATEKDLPMILTLVEEARVILSENNIPQWQNGDGPSQTILQKDIQRKQCYVLIAVDKIVGIGIISTEPEVAYEQLEAGEWLDCASPYVAIHRVAICPRYHGKGYAQLLLRYLVTTSRLMNYLDIRIDTHPKNKAMQHLITKNGFEYRGNIQLPVSNGERFAYQLLLS